MLVLSLVVIVVMIGTPTANWSRALALGLEFVALALVIATSREREDVQMRNTLLVGGAAAVVLIVILLGGMPLSVTFAIGFVLSVIIPLSLVGGLLRLIQRDGVNRRVVAGALAIYLLLGITFAMAVSFVAGVQHPEYFTSGTDGDLSTRVYYSFTVLTTTGFGDYTPGHGAGRALAVVEQLVGQLYLVTVIGVLVGAMAGRRTEPGGV